MPFTYILHCADGTLYTGSTPDLDKRLHEHNNTKSGARYTKARRPVRLVHTEEFASLGEARSREAAIKRLTRPEKLQLLRALRGAQWTKALLALALLLACCAVPGFAQPATRDITPEQAAQGSFEQDHAGGEAVFTCTLATSAADWARSGAESVVLSLDIDGVAHHDIVVTGAARIYRERVGPLPRGPHTWTLRWRVDVSPMNSGTVQLSQMKVATTAKGGVIGNAPILLGRLSAKAVRAQTNAVRDTPLMARSDVPLILIARERRDASGPVFEYHAVFSNEDGGTGRLPALQMMRYGRTSDVERVIVVNASGSEYQSANHGTARFAGRMDGNHAVLRVATDNNNFSDICGDEDEGLRFSLAPVEWPAEGPSQRVLEREPWVYPLANAEMLREEGGVAGLFGGRKAEQVGNAESVTLSDLGNYMTIESHIDAHKDQLWRVGARCAGRWWWSDHERASDRQRGGGWSRTGIEMPPGSTPDAVAFERIGDGASTLSIRELRAWTYAVDTRLPSAPLLALRNPSAPTQAAPRSVWELKR